MFINWEPKHPTLPATPLCRLNSAVLDPAIPPSPSLTSPFLLLSLPQFFALLLFSTARPLHRYFPRFHSKPTSVNSVCVPVLATFSLLMLMAPSPCPPSWVPAVNKFPVPVRLFPHGCSSDALNSSHSKLDPACLFTTHWTQWCAGAGSDQPGHRSGYLFSSPVCA